MQLPTTLNRHIAEALGAHTGEAVSILQAEPVGGGSIHAARKLITNRGIFFLKYNAADHRAMLQAEMEGLAALAATGTLPIAQPMLVDATDTHAFLLMDWIEGAPKTKGYWEDFGQGLAALHRHTAPRFGWHRDNFIGSLPQPNAWQQDGVALFALRMDMQMRLARDRQRIDAALVAAWERLRAKLPSILPVEPPALLHGDLWSGNCLTNALGNATLIDPAVFYGHREAELAFTRLFGGFAPDFYSAYAAAWPLQPGWQNRVALYNLYPLMVHLNLFGRSYLPQIQETLHLMA